MTPTRGGLRVVFVCSGNICRSPMAASVFVSLLADAGLADRVTVASAGIGPWHVGDPMDPRAAATLAESGYAVRHTAAQVGVEHLDADLLLAMDSGHYRELRRQVGNAGGDPARVRMFRSFDPTAHRHALDVPDPYYGGRDGFARLLDTIEAAARGLLEWVRARA